MNLNGGEAAMKIKQGMSDKQVGYLFVIPAVLIILIIAIWPVIQSFWISLHDVQLNDPAKNDVYQKYGINVEQFAGVYPTLSNNLNNLAKIDGDAKKKIEELKMQVDDLKTRLDEHHDFVNRYEQIDELLLNGDVVPETLIFIQLDEKKIQDLKKQINSIQKQAKELSHIPAIKKQNINLPGLVNGLKGSLITPNFVGINHYSHFLQDGRFWSSLWNTTFFTVVSVLLELILGMAIALLINRAFIGRGIVRASVLIPWAIPTVISALMWKFMFDGQNGILAKFIEYMGFISNMETLLTTKEGAMFVVILADVWKTTPFMSLLILAGLVTIPTHLYEAAKVDGASKMQQFFYITLPLLKSTILVALLFRTLDAFRIFDLIYALTGGGPGNTTETISIYAYKTMFAQMNFGAGSALSVMVFICVAIISVIYIKFLGVGLLHEGREK